MYLSKSYNVADRMYGTYGGISPFYNGKVVLTKNDFLAVFQEVWHQITRKRGCILNGFQFTGLFPLKTL
jgi:hypothetical protein